MRTTWIDSPQKWSNNPFHRPSHFSREFPSKVTDETGRIQRTSERRKMQALGTQYHSFPVHQHFFYVHRTQRLVVSLQLAQGAHIQRTTQCYMLNHVFNMIMLNASSQQNVQVF